MILFASNVLYQTLQRMKGMYETMGISTPIIRRNKYICCIDNNLELLTIFVDHISKYTIFECSVYIKKQHVCHITYTMRYETFDTLCDMPGENIIIESDGDLCEDYRINGGEIVIPGFAYVIANLEMLNMRKATKFIHLCKKLYIQHMLVYLFDDKQVIFDHRLNHINAIITNL